MKKLNEENFDEIITETSDSSKMALVKFGTIWCGPCRALAQKLKKLSQNNADNIKFYEVDADESPELCKRFNIAVVPVILIFKNGELAFRLETDFSESTIKKFLA